MRWLTVVLISAIMLIVAFGYRGYNIYSAPSPQQPTNPTEPIIPSNPQSQREPMQVIVINVGQGDAILVMNKNESMLVDCGKNSAKEDLLENLNMYTDHLDYLVVTHPDEDHVGGCDSVYMNMTVKKVLTNGVKATTKSYLDFENATKGGFNSVAYDGMKFSVGDASVEVLNSFENFKESNDNSIVMRVDYYNVSVLLTGDCEKKCEENIMQKNIDIDFLKVSHHGSNGTTSKEFIKKSTPVGAVISVGKNSYGHPSPEVIKRLEDGGAVVYRTDTSGDVNIKTYGMPLEKGDEDAKPKNSSKTEL